MINPAMLSLGAEPNKIRELFAYGLARKAEIGDDRVYDFSLGNPSVPTPEPVREAIIDLMELEPMALHGYTPASGLPAARQALADSFRLLFDWDADPESLYLTAGAAAALAITFAAVTEPGDEVIVIAPYFPEYLTWIENAGCTAVVVPAREPDFSLDIEAIAEAITPKTSALILNSPNNPTGAVYSRESLTALAELLREREREFGRGIYLVTDEPYRQITFGAEVPWIPALYDRTIVCSSFSKSLSLPGERIGYVYCSDRIDEIGPLRLAIAGAGRALGYVCAPVLFQYVVERCCMLESDVEAYRANRDRLCEGLAEIGYEFCDPQGAFYLWVKALEPDAVAFSERAKDFELLLVPSDSFGARGWVRVSYCVAPEVIETAMPAFQALFDAYRR